MFLDSRLRGSDIEAKSHSRAGGNPGIKALDSRTLKGIFDLRGSDVASGKRIQI